MNQERTLLFVDNSIDTFYSYRLPLAQAAKKAGFRVHVAAPRGACEQIILDEGFIYHPLRMTRRGTNFLNEFTTIFELFKLYKELKPDLVHHLRLKPVLYGGLAAQLAHVEAQVSMPTGLGYVFTANNLTARLMRRLILWGCKLAFFRRNVRVIFQNPDDQSVFTTGRAISPTKCVLIKGSGVDVREFAPRPEPDGIPTVILAARMLRDKGITEFVDAARLLKQRGVNARFVLVGDTDPGNPTAVPAAQLESWRDSGLVEWWGYRHDIEAVLAQANVVCLPSYREGVPKVLIEAAAMGRAIVTTDVAGCRDIVKHGQNGLLIPPKDPSALASAIRLLLENPGIRARMARRGRHLAVADFSLDRVITETIEVYHQVLTRQEGKLLEEPHGSRAKRCVDILLSSAALVCTAPLFIAIAAAVKLSSPGPVIYRGLRAGRNGEPFHILKFRSMLPNAESLGGSATANDDPRVTPIGRFLRRYKLDEIPQLLNVLKGEMSLVGPRPEVTKYVDQFRGDERKILSVQPGITDWASIWNSNEGEVLEGSPDPERAYEELIRPTKIALQLKYVRELSLWSDVKILVNTALKLIWPSWTPRAIAQYKKLERFRDLKKTMIENTTVATNDLPASVGGKPVLPEKFRFIVPSLPSMEQVLQYYRPAYEGGLITNSNCVSRFEDAAAEYLGVKYCIAVSSCTSGLMLVMRALGLTDEVIVPSFTFFATGHALRWNGLKPVFAECNPETWTIDTDDVSRLVNEKTSAILAVHLYGNPCQVDALSKITSRHKLKLIFDAAHAFGSKKHGRAVGQFGDAEVFSLSPTKTLIAGEGGLIATGDGTLARALKTLRNYGDTGSYDPDWLGMNARMTEFNAALALAGLPLVDENVKRRNRMAEMYTEALTRLPGIRFQSVDSKDVHTYKDYSIHINGDAFGCSRDTLAKHLLAENIETKKYFYPPLHRQQLYKPFGTRSLPNTDFVSDNILSLPIYESLPSSTVEAIVKAIHKIYNYNRPLSRGGKQAIYVTAEA